MCLHCLYAQLTKTQDPKKQRTKERTQKNYPILTSQPLMFLHGFKKKTKKKKNNLPATPAHSVSFPRASNLRWAPGESLPLRSPRLRPSPLCRWRAPRVFSFGSLPLLPRFCFFAVGKRKRNETREVFVLLSGFRAFCGLGAVLFAGFSFHPDRWPF